jgi:hypothetical protein
MGTRLGDKPLLGDRQTREVGNFPEVREYVGPVPNPWKAHGYCAQQAFTDGQLYEWLRSHACAWDCRKGPHAWSSRPY